MIMKKKHFNGITIVVIYLLLSLGGCPTENSQTDSNNKSPNLKLSSIRYETVPFSSVGTNVKTNDPYALVSSVKDNTTYYYLYYMGHVKSVPVAYKDSYRYNGITPITISFEKSWATEETITESMTKTMEETWNTSVSFTGGVELGGKADVKPFASTAVKVNISSTIGHSFGQTTSTSNTWETSKKKIQGEKEAIVATIGTNNEQPGIYRFALIGTTDVFCMFKVNPGTRAVKTAEIIYCVRENTYAWGIDYEPDENRSFDKTGGGALFSVPNVDFSTIPEPTDTVDTEPELPSSPVLPASIQVEQFSFLCIQDNAGYDPAKLNTSELESKEMDPRAVELVITGCAKPNDKYTIVDKLQLHLRMLNNTGRDQWPISNPLPKGSSAQHGQLEDDSFSGLVIGTGLNNTRIGYGAYQIWVNYSDGTNSSHTKYNFMKDKVKGDTINILEGISLSDKKIDSIRIVTVFELSANWQAIFWNKTVTNWRAEKTIRFNNI